MEERFGLIGERLMHSISPQIHGRIFEKLNKKASYELFELRKEQLGEKLQELSTSGVKGVNVTIPYKIEIMKYLDIISEEAKQIGAVNTVCFKDGKKVGYNTDYYGFGMLLENNGFKLRGRCAYILGGSGGAARCVIRYLKDNGIGDITIVSRRPGEAKAMNGLKSISYEKLELNAKGDIIINCTPCGMYPDINKAPVGRKTVEAFTAVVDLIYNPYETLFLKYAREAGIKYTNGLYMLVGQAVRAQELWNGICIDKTVIYSIYEELGSSGNGR